MTKVIELNPGRALSGGVRQELVDAFQSLEQATSGSGARYLERDIFRLKGSIAAHHLVLLNRDLLHLVWAVRATNAGDYARFIWGTLEVVRPARLRGCLWKALSGSTDHKIQRLACEEGGLLIANKDYEFSVPYPRLCRAIAYLDLMTGLGAYEDFHEAFASLDESTNRAMFAQLSDRTERCAYRILSDLLETKHYAQTFNILFEFLDDGGGTYALPVTVDDETIFDFWSKQAQLTPEESRGDFRRFITVVEDFVRFVQACQAAEDRFNLESGSEFNPDLHAGFVADTICESNPLGEVLKDLQTNPLDQVKFLKGTELALLERLAKFGNLLDSLHRTHLRTEVLGPLQHRVSRSPDERKKILAENEESNFSGYQNLKSNFAALSDRVTLVVKGVLYVLREMGEHQHDLPADASSSFKALRVKGFETATPSEPLVAEAFRMAPVRLQIVHEEIVRWLGFCPASEALRAHYELDFKRFAEVLHSLYD